ncbi:hypothetical protein [Vibrio hyugaensis]|uniref:hypothetical protein n=1 Tax=Vibrio hyugaensis TaxID=1534743 RepID=UPI000CE46B33|nr:hypothetical protein [Vibrio hyugaensis]
MKFEFYYKEVHKKILKANKLEDLIAPRRKSNNTGGVRSSVKVQQGMLERRMYNTDEFVEK